MTGNHITGEPDDFSQALEFLKSIFESVPVHQLLGMQMVNLDIDRASVKVSMKENFIGDYVNKFLHGGIISAILDSTGGLALWLEILKMLGPVPPKDLVNYLITHTIDLRLDFFNPGKGKFFLGTGSVINFGKRVAVVRTELHDEEGTLVAMSTGAYMIKANLPKKRSS